MLTGKISISAYILFLTVVSAAAAAGLPCNPANMVTPIRTAYAYEGGRTPETADTVFHKSIKFDKNAAVCIEEIVEYKDSSSPIIKKGLLGVWYPNEAREYLIMRKEWRLLDANEYNNWKKTLSTGRS